MTPTQELNDGTRQRCRLQPVFTSSCKYLTMACSTQLSFDRLFPNPCTGLADICARMARFVLGWEVFCSDGKIFDRMGRFGLGWEDLCLDGKDVFVRSSACKLHSWLLTALKSLTHSDRFKHNGELANLIMDKNHFNSKM